MRSDLQQGDEELLPIYENADKEIIAEWKNSKHVPPHLHEAIEMVYVTDGTLEIGVGQELYHMETGDFAIVFPNVIHHYQVFTEESKAIYVLANPAVCSVYSKELQGFSPQFPIMKKGSLHFDVVNSMKALTRINDDNKILSNAYIQVILAHVISEMHMSQKGNIGGDDFIYRVVEYVAKNFREEMTLSNMASDLGISKYVLSRIFAKIFHCNFTKYVNGIRLNYAKAMLENTQEPITYICLECGFESQRTFNRVFKEYYKMTPREYRKRRNLTNI